MSPHSESHYSVLGVVLSATFDEIKAAHRRKARELHPDKSPNRENEFLRVQKAWECLREQGRRNEYDQDLLRKGLRIKSKFQGAMPIKMEEMEEVEDDEGQLCYVYQCRCGDQIEIWQENLKPKQEPILVECPGCSFGYTVGPS